VSGRYEIGEDWGEVQNEEHGCLCFSPNKMAKSNFEGIYVSTKFSHLVVWILCTFCICMLHIIPSTSSDYFPKQH
jgi:hypothetical protein